MRSRRWIAPHAKKTCTGGVETLDFARVFHRSLCGPKALANLRAQPCDSPRVIPPPELTATERSFWVVGPPLASRCPCCNFVPADTLHAGLCPRTGTQVAQHQPLTHIMSHLLKRLSIVHIVEDGAPFRENRGLKMDIAIPMENPRDASIPVYCLRVLFMIGFCKRGPTDATSGTDAYVVCRQYLWHGNSVHSYGWYWTPFIMEKSKS